MVSTNRVNDIFVRTYPSCSAGTVHAGAHSVAPVLRVNGGIGLVTIDVHSPVTVSLGSSPGGPSPGRYVLWVWSRLPTGQFGVGGHGQTIGCAVNPSPLNAPTGPQPVACLRGAGIRAIACGSVAEFPAPVSIPWISTATRGIPVPAVVTLQGIIEDSSAGNSLGFSVTNALVLVVQ